MTILQLSCIPGRAQDEDLRCRSPLMAILWPCWGPLRTLLQSSCVPGRVQDEDLRCRSSLWSWPSWSSLGTGPIESGGEIATEVVGCRWVCLPPCSGRLVDELTAWIVLEDVRFPARDTTPQPGFDRIRNGHWGEEGVIASDCYTSPPA